MSRVNPVLSMQSNQSTLKHNSDKICKYLHLEEFWTIAVLKEGFSKSRLYNYMTHIWWENILKAFSKAPQQHLSKCHPLQGRKALSWIKKGLDDRKDKAPITMGGNHQMSHRDL